MKRLAQRFSYYRKIRRHQGHVLTRRESLRRAWHNGPRKVADA